MILPDVNVLIYAFRSDANDHTKYKEWLESIINGPAAFGVAPQILASVLRICTHRRIFVRPSSARDAFAFCRAILEHPQATLLAPRDRHWDIFETLCQQTNATGNLLQDAWFAALAIESGCEWVTTDRDYARFEGLSWRTPF